MPKQNHPENEDEDDELYEGDVCPDCGEVHAMDESSFRGPEEFFMMMVNVIERVNKLPHLKEGITQDINTKFSLLLQDFISDRHKAMVSYHKAQKEKEDEGDEG